MLANSKPSLSKPIRHATDGSESPRPKASMLSKLRMVVLLLILVGLGGYAWRKNQWQRETQSIEKLLDLRSSREALKAIRGLDQRWGRSSEGHFFAARAYRYLEDFDKAAEELNQASVRGMVGEQLTHELTLQRIQSGGYDPDKDTIEDILGDTAAPMLENADALMQGLLRVQAIPLVNSVLDFIETAEPKSFWLPYYRGLVSKAEEKIDEAHRSFVEANELEPRFALASLERGKAAWLMQQPDEAITHLTAYLQTNPDDEGAQTGMVEALIAVGRFKEAYDILKPYSKDVDLNSDMPRYLGKTLIGLNKCQDAVNAMIPAFERWPSDVDLATQLAEAYQSLGDESNAKRLDSIAQENVRSSSDIVRIRAELKKTPSDPGLVAMLGHLVLKHSSRVEGVQILLRSLSMYAGIRMVHEDLAHFYRVAGNLAQAEMHEEALKKIPNESPTK